MYDDNNNSETVVRKTGNILAVLFITRVRINGGIEQKTEKQKIKKNR